MNRIRFLAFLVAAAFLAAAVSPVIALAQGTQPDEPGCKDHPLFTRMKNMLLTWCKTVEFDVFTFIGEKGKQVEVEGRKFEGRYSTQEGFEPPGALAIRRNHQQAIKNIGGTVVYDDDRYTTLMIVKDGKEIWAQVDTAWGRGYILNIVEKEAMVQEVVASAELFKAGLNASGHVEVPGIFFDTGKSVLKPESDAAVAEIAKLLAADPGLKVYVVGHTDNVAALDLNMKLSQARADAVVQALVTKHGIAGERLTGRGVGPLAPVASNDAEEGRAKNRRVELVKQ